MGGAQFTALEWLALVEHELLLFAGVFFLIGALDELAVDLTWIWLRLTGRGKSGTIIREEMRSRSLSGPAALLIPAWREERVIEHTIAHALHAWPQAELTLYAGSYRNDPATQAAALRGANGDPRVRLVVLDRDGPTTKADCLNGLYAAMAADERNSGEEFRMVLLHDAEDMVDPAALGLLDRAIGEAEFVQLPVLPEPQPASRWVGSHYIEEFCEAHAKGMVVREALGAALPAAGVGCCFDRRTLAKMELGGEGPFSVSSLTEDYELGLRIKASGGRSRFLRVRGEDGRLVATRACFPPRVGHAVRQKARWVHGIALQGWDRMGWGGSASERWMRLRDRRGPLTAVVLLSGYLLLVVGGALLIAGSLGLGRPVSLNPVIAALIGVNLAFLAWRALLRSLFTAREYGWAEGLWAVLRIPVANYIAILAGRRAVFAYIRTLRGQPLRWDKTAHYELPAAIFARRGR
jgi:bacteriophage N4 adsorption protein B